MEWLDTHQSEEADVYENKRKEIEEVVNPSYEKIIC